ncbi:MAG: formylglycine-generating enzyme family protein [Fibrobacterota bacterium]|nr:formylglycine-generating enzyme family protein [Fibrobacterota bacterium]
MQFRFRHACFLVVGLSSGALALGTMQVENAVVGQRTIILTIEDSIQAPDLSKIRVEGYEIESAVFIEEMGTLPTRFVHNYMDLTLAGAGKVVEYVPTLGTMILELPQGSVPSVGSIIADTAFGGLLRKVTEVNPQSQPGVSGRRWSLATIEADFPEAVMDCDIAFKTRMDMNQALGDFRQSAEVLGTLADGSPTDGHLDITLTGAQVLFQPVVSGRIQVRNGKVELFRFQTTGDCEVMANMRTLLSGVGDFSYEEELPGKAPMLVPLGSGLFLRMRNRPSLHVDIQSKGETLTAHADFRVRNSIKGELGFSAGQWQPLAENKMTWANKALLELRGNGQVKLSIKPRMEMLLEGVQGPVFTFDSYARFNTAPSQAPTMGESLAYGAANKELSLGANIFMETRTNFTGPASLRNFLLFSREQSVLSPPREGTLALKEADSNRIALNCQTYPKSDYYVIQAKLGAGPWETLIDKASSPKIRTAMLKPSSQYRFRALGVNAMGMGPAFPLEGVAYTTPALNRPPFQPIARFPDSGAVVADLQPVIAWKGGDPDAGAKVQYTIYLDSKLPPLSIRAGGVPDTSLALTDLKPGTTYFWKVVAFDGMDRSEGPVQSFTTKSAEPVEAQPAKTIASPYPVVFLPKGSYRREDGRMVQVGPLFLGKYEVTQTEFEKVTGRNPSYRLQDSLPVDRVTWEEAESYCRETGGRLPTEAEWEYAARAGNPSTFYWGGETAGDYAWYRDNSDNRTQKVGLKKPNVWGLHDMAGNVFEWVQDWYGDYSLIELNHPKGPGSGTARVIRGASWYSESGSLSLTARYNNRPGFRNFKVGFRCAKDPDRTAFENDDPSQTLAGKSPDPSKPDVSPAK